MPIAIDPAIEAIDDLFSVDILLNFRRKTLSNLSHSLGLIIELSEANIDISLLHDFYMTAQSSTITLPFGSEEIKKIIPHRYPFLLVDRITELRDDYVKGYKNVTCNEEFFQGHFPTKAIMPGVLIVEAIAQIVCVSELLKENDRDKKYGIFAGIDGARFKNPVFPGDKLELEAWILWSRRGVGKCKGQASVDGKICFTGELTFAMVDGSNLK